MTRPRSVLLLAVLAVASIAGVVVAIAQTGGTTDPSPPKATRDVPGVVSLGRPLAKPYAAGKPKTGQIEMRVTDPDGGPPSAVLHHRWEKLRRGTVVRFSCHEHGPERQLRTYPTDSGGSCRPLDSDVEGPWSLGVGSGSDIGTIMAGSVRPEVRRLTLAGPGGTFVVPRSATGGFVIKYGEKVTGRAVLTATLADGTTRYHRTSIPPTFRPDGVAVAKDPGGLPDWYTGAGDRRRANRTCLQVVQMPDLRGRRDRRAGIGGLAPTCGDLRVNPVFARTVQLRPTARRNQFGGGPNAPRRTILAGAVTKQVRAVAVRSPTGRRVLDIAPAGRAFLAVFPPSVRPSDLVLEVTLQDGTTQRFPDPVAVNRAVSQKPTPYVVGKVSLRNDPAGSRRIVLRALLDRTAERFEITFLGREVRMRPVPGQRHRYVGVYDGTRGARRPVVPGRIYRFTTLTCGEHCDVTLARARLK